MDKLQRACTLFDLEKYVNQTFHKIRPSGDELRINCFHCGDTKQHLWVNIVKRRWICYKCGYGDPRQQEGTGWLPRFIADAEGIPIVEVCKRLLERVELTPADELGDLLINAFAPDPNKISAGALKLPPSFVPVRKGGSTAVAYHYGLRRGLEEGSLQFRFDVRSCSDVRQRLWKNRLIFPVRDLDGWVRSAIGRDITGKAKATWQVWPRTDIQSLLWPLYWFEKINGVNGGTSSVSLRDMNPQHIVLVEGIFDWVGVEGAGFPALATFGKKLSQQQVAVLQELGLQEVTLAWDWDAQDKMVKLVDRLRGRFNKVYVFSFLNSIWKDRDFGDIPGCKDLQDIFVDEMKHRILVDSYQFLEWAAKVALEGK